MKPLRGLSMTAMAENAMHRTNGRISNRIIFAFRRRVSDSMAREKSSPKTIHPG